MNVALINIKQKLPIVDDVKKGVRLDNSIVIPTDIAYCASVLREEGFAPFIVDANTERLSDEQVIERLKEKNPKMIVINSTMIDRWLCPFLNIDAPVRTSLALKKSFPESKIVIIGPHGTYTPEWVLKKGNGNIDFVIINEPEETLRELSHAIEKNKKINGIKGLAFKEKEKTIITLPRSRIINLDSLPMPAYDLLPMGKFKGGVIVSSRGCPFQCTFCTQGVQKGAWLFRTPKNVVDEIQVLVEKYGFKHIYFQDLEFTVHNKRVIEICDEIIKRKLKFKWRCSGRFTDIREKEFLSKMKEAGCYAINLGLESGSKKILELCNKKISLDDVPQVAEWCKETGIHLDNYLICALPGETKETLKESIAFMAKHNLGMGGGNLPIPYPGTALYEMAKKQGLDVSWENLGNIAGTVGTDILKELPPEELYKFITITHFKEKYSKLFYINPVFWIEQSGFLKDAFKRKLGFYSK